MLVNKISINTKILSSRITGVQRYLIEVSLRLPKTYRALSPKRPLIGIRGHFWEQFVLPFLVGRTVLWSPSNTGPLWIKRQIVTIHDISPIDHPEWLSRKFAMFYQFLTPRLVRRSQRIITDSQFTKDRIIKTTNVSPEKIVVIPCGVDPKFCPRSRIEIEASISPLNLPSARYLLTVGSLEPRKNLGRLLRAWALAHDRMPDDLWLVVAGGKGSAAIFARETGVEVLVPRVHLTGHVPDDILPALYAGAAGFCYMSLYEGFGLPPLEAMASGVPVLVSEGTAFPEVVGDCGLYANPLDLDAIAQQMVKLVNDTSASALLAARGLERAKLFTWDECAKRTFEVLQSVAADN